MNYTSFEWFLWVEHRSWLGLHYIKLYIFSSKYISMYYFSFFKRKLKLQSDVQRGWTDNWLQKKFLKVKLNRHLFRTYIISKTFEAPTDIIRPNVDWRYSFYILLDRTQNTSSMSKVTPRRKNFFNSSYQSSFSTFREYFQSTKIKAVFDIPNMQWNWLSFADSGSRFEPTQFVKIHWLVMWSLTVLSRLSAFQCAKYEIIH